LLLDGGLASEIEARGGDLADPLWSARTLIEDPDLIRRIHLDYLEAGADCVTSASYQASFAGLRRRGLDDDGGTALLRRSVALAREARDAFLETPAGRRRPRRPLVAASVGPYGATLADGSEYTGAYDLDEDALVDFHRRRLHVLATSGADLLACETLPSAAEARALVRLLAETPETPAWLSFTCRDEARISDGTPLAEIAAELDSVPQILAVGVNCTPPSRIPALIDELRRATSKPIVVYPNSGESWDAGRRRWTGTSSAEDFGCLGALWRERGASVIGGCCRTGPEHIRALRRELVGPSPP